MNKKYRRYIKLLKFLSIIAIILLIPLASYYIKIAPLDYQQGVTVRILYLHVPCAWLSLLCYSAMALCSLLNIIKPQQLYGAVIKVVSKIGANITLMTLICGSLWGSVSWGSYWVWDARLVSELILLLLYLGIISLNASFTEETKGDFASSILCLIGSINLPIIKFSVKWWNSIHQGESISLLHHSNIAPLMYDALIYSALALCSITALIFLINLELELYHRAYKRHKHLQSRIKYKKYLEDI